MTPRLSQHRRIRSWSPETKIVAGTEGLTSLVTFIVVILLVLTGPLMLGAARLWVELPLLCGVACLLFFQGLRLMGRPSIGTIRRIDAIDISVLLFVLYALVRWLTSPTEYFSRMEAMEIVAYAGIFFTCRYGLAPRSLGVALLFGLVALGVFETWFGYYLSRNLDWFPFGPDERLQIYYAPRWLGTYGCPNHYGGLLVMAIGSALALGSFSKLAWPLRIVFFYLAGMMMLGLMFSISRGSWIAFGAASFALMIFGVRNGAVRWWIPVSGTILLLIGVIVVFSQSSNVRARVGELQKTVHDGNLNTYVRVELAEDALRIAKDHPFFGTGPGTFVFIHPRYQSNTFHFKAVLTHDDYLNCLDDYGIIGFGLAMFFVAAVTLKFLQPLRAENRWQDRVMIAAGCAAWGALVVHSAFDFNLHIPANALLFFSLTGLALGRMKRDDISHWSTISLAPLGRGVGLVVVALSLLYGFEAGRSAISDIIYEEAFQEVPASDAVERTQDALSYDSGNANALLYLGDLYRYRASRKQDMDARITEGQKALDYYQKALKANDLDDTIRARMGMTFDVMGRYSEAFFCYTQAATAQPNNGQFWFWLGNHYWERGMLVKAVEAYRRSELCPHGSDGSGQALQELRELPGMQNVVVPATSVNPLTAPTTENESTIP